MINDLRIKKFTANIEGISLEDLKGAYNENQKERNDEFFRNGAKGIKSFGIKDNKLIIQFAEQRLLKPVLGKTYEEIEEDVFEITTMIFVNKADHLEAYTEYNHSGVKVKNIEKILNNVFAPDISFSFEPIYSDLVDKVFAQSTEIKEVEITSHSITSSFAPKFSELVEGINRVTSALEADQVTMKISPKLFKQDCTDEEKKNFVRLLLDLHTETECLSKLNVKCKYIKNGKEHTDYIHIIGDTVIDIILNVPIETHGSEFVIDKMLEQING